MRTASSTATAPYRCPRRHVERWRSYAANVMLSAAKHLTPRRGVSSRRCARPFASLRVTGAYGVEYGDRTVSMSEASRRAVEKLSGGIGCSVILSEAKNLFKIG